MSVTNAVHFTASFTFVCLFDQAGALSNNSVWRLSVGRLFVAYIGPKSRTERPRKTKIGTEVAHVTRDSLPLSRSKVRGQGHNGGGILWRPPSTACATFTAALNAGWKKLNVLKSGKRCVFTLATLCIAQSMPSCVLSVRLSVCLSHAGIMSKRLNLKTLWINWYPHHSSFAKPKIARKIWQVLRHGSSNKGAGENCESAPILPRFSETTPDRAIVTIERQYEVIRSLSNGIIFDDLEWPLTRV